VHNCKRNFFIVSVVVSNFTKQNSVRAMKVTYLGHATVLVELKGKTILFDPFISPNDLAKDVKIDALKVDYIFISHGHEDHIADVERIVRNTGAKIVANFEICQWFEKKGCTNFHPMNTGGKWYFDGVGTVKMVSAVHSSTMPDGASGGLPNGFVFETEEGNFYFAGDTALTLDMKLIPMFTKLNFAILPIGDNFTMGIEEAIVAAQFVEVEHVIGIHFDTFGYIKIDHSKALEAFKNKGIQLTLKEIGESIEING
jgi:L-ascorbate metabolism protein UlaG (beta-lactamase superfamily)